MLGYKTKTFNMKVPEKAFKRLKSMSKRKGASMAALVRAAIIGYLHTVEMNDLVKKLTKRSKK